MGPGFNRFFLAFAFLTGSFCLHAQSKVYTFVQENSNVYEKSDFYILRVIDTRDNKDNIGNIYSTDKRKKYPGDFKQPLINEFSDFFKNTFPSGKHKHRIVLLVNSFSIGHDTGWGAKDIGSAGINADFYLSRNDTCYYITNVTKQIEEESEDVQLSHPNRIKRLLLICIAEMADSLKKFEYGITVNGSPSYSMDELKKKSLSKDVERRRAKQNENTLPEYYMFNFGTYYSFSQPVLQFGFTGNLVLQIKKAPQYLVGINANIMMFGAPPDNVQLPLSASFDVFNYDLGIKLLKQVKNNFFLNLNPQVNLGYIKELNSSSRKNILGIEIDAGIYLIPPVEQGVYSGLNLFYRNTNNEFLGEAFGIKLDLGYRF